MFSELRNLFWKYMLPKVIQVRLNKDTNKFMDCYKLVLVEQISTKIAMVLTNAKLTVIYRIGKKNNILDIITAIIETHKDKCVKHLQTLTSNGFNIKLNRL